MKKKFFIGCAALFASLVGNAAMVTCREAGKPVAFYLFTEAEIDGQSSSLDSVADKEPCWGSSCTITVRSGSQKRISIAYASALRKLVKAPSNAIVKEE